MPRRARKTLLYDGCLAHILSRSIETKWIFEREEEFLKFKNLLVIARDKHEFLVHHYCLMNTHFHMAVKIMNVDSFAAGMKWLKREYTKWYNERAKRRGTIWQDRYKSLLIENASYLKACGKYIERNPVEVGLAKESTDWPFSSANYYEQGCPDDLVTGYEYGGGLPKIEKEDFETGVGIGSEFFKFYLREDLLSVP